MEFSSVQFMCWEQTFTVKVTYVGQMTAMMISRWAGVHGEGHKYTSTHSRDRRFSSVIRAGRQALAARHDVVNVRRTMKT